jgi:hypothetical protein
MDDGPRRRRAKAWVWVYLALFGDGNESAVTETESADQLGGAEPEPSDRHETR